MRGASGVVFGMLWSQISLLALNFEEMPARWLRLLVLVGLILVEVLTYHYERDPKTSYTGHLFAAIAGVAISLVSGHNVVFRRWELVLTIAGAAAYFGLCIWIFVSHQFAVGGWAAAVGVVLNVDIYRNLLRGWKDREGGANVEMPARSLGDIAVVAA